jgi:acetyltransferase-like isoleucine patch superfamily enzyme
MRRLALAIQTARCMARLRRRGIRTGLVTCEGRPPLVHHGGRCRIGRLAISGLTAPAELGARPGGELVIGDRVFINQGASVVAAHSITIGDDARIGDYACVYDSNHHPIEPDEDIVRAPVVIGRNAWLARGAIVLPGVTVGDHAVVAAGAIVSRNVPARTLVAGNPARIVRELRADEGWSRQ